MTTNLGTMEELPADYRDAVASANATPLWPLMRKALPHDAPQPQSKACLWAFDTIRPLLLRAGELTPVEKAEARADPLRSRPRTRRDARRRSDLLRHAIAAAGGEGAGASPYTERGAHRGGRRRRLHHRERRKMHDGARRPDPHAGRRVARSRS